MADNPNLSFAPQGNEPDWLGNLKSGLQNANDAAWAKVQAILNPPLDETSSRAAQVAGAAAYNTLPLPGTSAGNAASGAVGDFAQGASDVYHRLLSNNYDPEAKMPDLGAFGGAEARATPGLFPSAAPRNDYEKALGEVSGAVVPAALGGIAGRASEALGEIAGSGDTAGLSDQTGAIRLDPDILPPAVARVRAEIMANGSINPAIVDALAKHIQKYGGKANDPLADVPLMGDSSEFYGDLPTISSGSIPGITEAHKALPVAKSGTWGALMDRNLISGGAEGYPSSILFGGDVNALSSPIVRQDIIRTMTGSGIPSEYWPKQYATSPQGSLVFKMPVAGNFDARSRLAMQDLEANLEGLDLKGKNFSTMVNMANKNYAAILRQRAEQDKGIPTLDTGDGFNWQELTKAQELWREGSRDNMANCIKDPTYCNLMEAGKTRIFSLRDNDTNEPKLTLSTGYDPYRNHKKPPDRPTFPTELKRDAIGQIKGKANTIRPQFLNNVQQLIDHLNLDPNPSGDWFNMGGEEKPSGRQEEDAWIERWQLPSYDDL